MEKYPIMTLFTHIVSAGQFHFKNHPIRHASCLEPGCDTTFDTVYDFTTHHLVHQNAEPREKIICNYSKRILLPECHAPTLNPHKTARHVLLHHIQKYASFQQVQLVLLTLLQLELTLTLIMIVSIVQRWDLMQARHHIFGGIVRGVRHNSC